MNNQKSTFVCCFLLGLCAGLITAMMRPIKKGRTSKRSRNTKRYTASYSSNWSLPIFAK